MPNPTAPSSETPPKIDVQRILALALFASDFMTWKCLDGPTDGPESIQVETHEGVVDDELVDMIDGGLALDFEGRNFSFEPREVKSWSAIVTKFWDKASPEKPRFDGAATHGPSVTICRLGARAQRVFERHNDFKK